MKQATRVPDVFSAGELARVTGLPVRQIRTLIRTAAIRSVDGKLVTRQDAVEACRALIDGRRTVMHTSRRALFSRDPAGSTRRGHSAGVSLLLSGSVHGAMAAIILIVAAVAVPRALPDDTRALAADLVRLIFVADPGPGGGGGGGGLRQPAPPPQAERAGERPLSSPVPRRRPPRAAPPPARPVSPPHRGPQGSKRYYHVEASIWTRPSLPSQ